jgi:hypothetical protein
MDAYAHAVIFVVKLTAVLALHAQYVAVITASAVQNVAVSLVNVVQNV